MGWKLGLRIGIPVVFVISAFIGCMCMIAYTSMRDYNSGYVPGTCGIVGYTLQEYGNDRRKLYRGFVVVVVPNIVTKSIEVANNYPDTQSISAYLRSAYPIGSWRSCFYNVDQGGDVIFRLSPAGDAFIASMIFFGIACVCVLAFVASEIAWCFC
jgi:hypothetical protein